MEDRNNFIGLVGKLETLGVKDGFYMCRLVIPRIDSRIPETCDTVDVKLPFTVHDACRKKYFGEPSGRGCKRIVMVSGRIWKKTRGIGNPTNIYVEAGFISRPKYPYWQNGCILKGRVANKPTVRITPLGRKIADVMLSIPDRDGGYNVRIPCICWERNAERAATLKIGDTLEVRGRLQSREYVKKYDDESLEPHTVHEVSVSHMHF